MSIYSKIHVNPEETFNKIVENLNFDSFGGPKIWASGDIFYTPTKVASMSVWFKLGMNPMENVLENRRKPITWPSLAKKGPKIWPTGAIFHAHLKLLTIYL